jgi:hypothetical protein
VIWSSPPIVASTARIAGSAYAAIRSAARSAAGAPSRRVVGYSTGSSSKSSRSRRMACSCCAGYAPGAAYDGETIATRSPGFSFGGTLRSGRMPPSNPAAQPYEAAFAHQTMWLTGSETIKAIGGAYPLDGGEAVATRPTVDIARIRAWLPAYGVYVAIVVLVLYNIAFTPNFLA